MSSISTLTRIMRRGVCEPKVTLTGIIRLGFFLALTLLWGLEFVGLSGQANHPGFTRTSHCHFLVLCTVVADLCTICVFSKRHQFQFHQNGD
uniref:Uncharacterized protein n=1 Tax=Anguilla anguilla TaxID=7936 RepID=A0A0E9TZI3_ANGAN